MAIIELVDPNAISRFSTHERIMRDGFEVEKGVIIDEQWMIEHEDLVFDYWEKFAAYPDLMLDLIYKPVDSSFEFFPFQRIFLRSCMRYNNIYITACRATSKTFLSILAKYCQCILLPGHVGSIVAPKINQAAKIAKQKIYEIWNLWPLLRKEIAFENGKEKANFSKDYVELRFRNGSVLMITGATDSNRGLRTHATFLDEARDSDGDAINEIILPQMNVSRRGANGIVNPYEKINTQVIWGTSAGSKSSFAYGALIDVFEKAIIDPKNNFVMGLDYRIPMNHGLIDRNFIKNLKLSNAYNESTFAAE